MSPRLVRALTALGAVLVLGSVDYAIYGKERIIREGETIYLELAPVDPRSLMQGDYMALRFRLADRIESWRAEEGRADLRTAPLSVDERGVATLREDDGGGADVGVAASGERGPPVIAFRIRRGRVWLGTNAYFFAEGTGARYTGARYGEFRVDPSSGEAVLVGLRDASLNALAPGSDVGDGAYVPGPGDAWQTRSPEEVGMDPVLLRQAVGYALAHETTQIPEDPGRYLRDRFEGLPYQDIVGPTRERGGVNGLVVKDGYIVAEWGPTDREDMTFSVTKSYLSTVAGLAWDDGLIRDLDDPIGEYVTDGTFASEHNARITWHHLLQQTSEWEGTLWGKPDIADRRRGIDRELREPGTFWEYNDVRVNLMAYSLLVLFQRPLPEVLKERIMDPIGASGDWRWHGYETSWTDIGGERMQSVSGGGHWGGGLIIDSRDHARFGLLALRRGRWGDRQLVPAEWFERATTPTDIQPDYGYMWWLNTGREQLPAAPESAFYANGAGSTNIIYVDPEHDLVTVTRWVDGAEHVNEFIRLVLASIEEGSGEG